MVFFTAGYEGASLEDFLYSMHRAGVVQVIDVRRVPLSRKKGFSKTALREALDAEGFEYFHFRELGCPQFIRDRYKVDADWNWYTKNFKSFLSTCDDQLAELIDLISLAPSCLLCFEENPKMCHRSLIAQQIVKQTEGALSVQNLFPRGQRHFIAAEAGGLQRELFSL